MSIAPNEIALTSIQMGKDASASKNFHITALGDGGFALKRGNIGAPISQPLVVDGSNNVWFANRIGSGADAVVDSDIPRWGQVKSLRRQSAHFHTSGELIMNDSWGNDGGTFNYIYPPYGYNIFDLRNVFVSIREIYYNGIVDNNDSTYCYYEVEWANNRIKVICYSSEQRYRCNVNWRVEWNINLVL